MRKDKDKAGEDVSGRQTDDGTEDLMEWECADPLSAASPVLARRPLPSSQRTSFSRKSQHTDPFFSCSP